MDLEKWSSRKLILTGVSILLLAVIPIIYHKLGIGEAVTLFVLGAVGAAVGFYNVANVLSKKYPDNLP